MSTILLVDDEKMVLSVLERVLAKPGRTFLLATTAEEALDQARRAPALDVALVDKNLVEVSGIELGRQLRAVRQDIEVILMTAYASTDSAIEAVRMGAYDYITKPIEDFGALNLKVESAAEKSALRQKQRALLERLRESEERYRRVFESANDAMLVCTGEGQILEANSAAMKLYGHTAEQFRTLNFEALAGPPAGLVTRHIARDGRTIDVEVASSELALGNRTLRIHNIRDLTERNRLESQLRQSQKVEVLGKLAGGVVHDFNNLLAVILGTARTLQPELQGEARAGIEAIVDAGTRGALLTRQLLSFGRSRPSEREPLDLSLAVEQLEVILERTLPRNIALSLHCEKQLPRVVLVPDQVMQLVLNLAVNARDAMPRGGKLSIEVGAAPPPAAGGPAQGSWVTLVVRDTGHGMPPEVVARVFEPFFTTKPEGQGTGLGLATVDSIVRASGGRIEVQSELGVGTTFRLLFPAAPQAAAQNQVRPPSYGRETILIAEQDEAVRAMIRLALECVGYRVLEARDGNEALERAGAHPGQIHMLIADVMMSGSSGRELARVLGRRSPNLAVLFVSGNPEGSTMLESVESEGGRAYMEKALTSSSLLATVRNLLDQARAAGMRSTAT